MPWRHRMVAPRTTPRARFLARRTAADGQAGYDGAVTVRGSAAWTSRSWGMTSRPMSSSAAGSWLSAVLRMTCWTPASAKAAVQTALDSELRVTAQFDALAAAAQEAADFRSQQFLQWFIEEQVEDERTMRGLHDLIDSGLNLFVAEQMLGARE